MLILQDFREFLDKQKKMDVSISENGVFIIKGEYRIVTWYKDIFFDESFNLLIEVSPKYPEIGYLPKVFSSDNKIPRHFNHMFSDDSFCLGATMQLNMSAKDNSISDFLTIHIDSYLFTVSYFIKYGEIFPFGERSHGFIGTFEFWQEYLNLKDYYKIHKVMTYTTNGVYRGHSACPCESGLKLRNCHGEKLFYIINNGLCEEVKKDLYFIEKGIEIYENQRNRNNSAK